MSVVFGLAALVGLLVFFSLMARNGRRQRLLEKYGDARIVDMIMRRVIWEGMTTEQLVDSRGRWADYDEKVYKTKVVRTYKYNRDGRNRFRTRITVENDQVVGWQVR